MKQKLRVWWISQVPMKSFKVEVKNFVEAKLLLDTLAHYDMFQLKNNIKPDYCNAGGLQIFVDDEWVDWHPEDTDGFVEAADKLQLPSDECIYRDGIDEFTLEEIRKIQDQIDLPGIVKWANSKD